MERRFENTNGGNPVLSRMSKYEDITSGEKATFKGIALKSFYFLALIILGIAAFLYMHSYFGREGYDAYDITESYVIYANEMMIFIGATIITLISGLVAAFAPRTTAVTGSIYCAGMGYAITFISYTYAAAVKGIVIEALLLTILLIAVMAVLYFTGIVKVGRRFRTLVYTALTATLIASVIYMLLRWIFPSSSLVRALTEIQYGPIGIVFAFLGVALGCLLVIDDFDHIVNTVNYGLSQKYEWTASYGLMISIIYLYLRVLELIFRFSQKKN